MSRRAGCEKHLSGSVRGAPGRPGASTRSERGLSTKRKRRRWPSVTNGLLDCDDLAGFGRVGLWR
jgi:hypothetical protein